jgi:hypothetical protein
MNERINQIEPLVQQAHAAPITEAPDVLQLDGIWLTLQTQSPTIQPDKRQRARHQRKGERVVVLVALGLWRDGRREILDCR